MYAETVSPCVRFMGKSKEIEKVKVVGKFVKFNKGAEIPLDKIMNVLYCSVKMALKIDIGMLL